MRTEGQTLTCDVCGASVFLAHTGDGEADGGFTRWREYEKPPEGWNSAACVASATFARSAPSESGQPCTMR